MKSSFLVFIISLSLLISGCPPTPIGKVVDDLARERLGISILAVNLIDILNVPDSQNGTPWQTRYTRIYTWMRDTQTFPDIIALQEAPGFWSCPTDGRRLPDYAAIDFLLDGIREVTGEQYRIAYLIALKPGGTRGDAWVGRDPAQFCSAQGGRALLYRPSRVRNVITGPSTGIKIVSPYDTDPRESYLARSVQCCSPASDRRDVCQVIDGVLDTPQSGHYELTMGTCPTAIGVAWTRNQFQGQRPNQDAVFSRLELVNELGNFIHVYNVHRRWEQDDPTNTRPGDVGAENVNQLVTDMENRFHSSNNPTLYPPILVGDFNIGTDLTESYFPRFEVGMWGPEVMGVLFGKDSSFPAKQKAYANSQQTMPELLPDERCDGVQGKLWSDHCGIFFRVEPSRR